MQVGGFYLGSQNHVSGFYLVSQNQVSRFLPYKPKTENPRDLFHLKLQELRLLPLLSCLPMRHPLFHGLCIANLFWSFGSTVIYMYLPAYAISTGTSFETSTFLVSCVGMASFCSRMIFAFMGHNSTLDEVGFLLWNCSGKTFVADWEWGLLNLWGGGGGTRVWGGGVGAVMFFLSCLLSELLLRKSACVAGDIGAVFHRSWSGNNRHLSPAVRTLLWPDRLHPPLRLLQWLLDHIPFTSVARADWGRVHRPWQWLFILHDCSGFSGGWSSSRYWWHFTGLISSDVIEAGEPHFTAWSLQLLFEYISLDYIFYKIDTFGKVKIFWLLLDLCVLSAFYLFLIN